MVMSIGPLWPPVTLVFYRGNPGLFESGCWQRRAVRQGPSSQLPEGTSQRPGAHWGGTDVQRRALGKGPPAPSVTSGTEDSESGTRGPAGWSVVSAWSGTSAPPEVDELGPWSGTERPMRLVWVRRHGRSDGLAMSSQSSGGCLADSLSAFSVFSVSTMSLVSTMSSMACERFSSVSASSCAFVKLLLTCPDFIFLGGLQFFERA